MANEFKVKNGLIVGGDSTFSGNITIPQTAATTDTDKFAVLDAGIIKFRSGSQILSDIGAQAAGTYNTIIGTDTDINFTGSTVLSTMTLTDGVIQGFTPRTLTPGDIGAQTALTNPITGTGTTNYLPKFTGTTTLGNSLVLEQNSGIGIGGGVQSGFRLDVHGQSVIRGSVLTSGDYGYFGGGTLGIGGFTTGMRFLNGSSGLEAMRLDINNNLIIGSTSVSGQQIAKLSVHGGSGYGTQNGVVSFRRDDAPSNTNTIGYIATFQRINSSTAAWYLGANTSSDAILASNNTNLIFGKDLSGSFTEYFRLNTLGNGIFTNSVQADSFIVTGASSNKILRGDGSLVNDYDLTKSFYKTITTDANNVPGDYWDILELSVAEIVNIIKVNLAVQGGGVGFSSDTILKTFFSDPDNVYEYGSEILPSVRNVGSHKFKLAIKAVGSNAFLRIYAIETTNKVYTLSMNISDVTTTRGTQTSIFTEVFTFGNATLPTITQPYHFGSETKVGIGTNNPLGKLHISEGSLNTYPTVSTSADDFIIENKDGDAGLTIFSDNGAKGSIYFGDEQSNQASGIISDNTAGKADLYFTTNGNNERMRITSSGSVGIGTTSPSQKLEVNGNIKLSETAASTDTDKFAVLDNGIIKFRTGAQVLSDIGAQVTGSYDNYVSWTLQAQNQGGASLGTSTITSSDTAIFKAGTNVTLAWADDSITINSTDQFTGTVTGTGENNQVAIWNGTTTQSSSANLTFNGTTLTIGGNINTGQGATEVYLMDQNVRTTDAVTFTTVNTGQGATEVYLMGQNVRTTDAVTFSNVLATGFVGNNTKPTRDKLRVWNDSTYTMGFKSGYSFGHLGEGSTDYAMSFQMSNTDARGFWWGDSAHTDAQGAMSLTTTGKANIAKSLSIGEGESVTSPSTTPLYVQGSGSTILDIQGSQGQLFSVTDDLTGDIFTVSDISGIPILNVNADGTTTQDGNLIVSGSVEVTGNVIAPSFTGSLQGNANSATQVSIVDASADTTTFVVLAGDATGVQTLESDAGLTYNASSNALSATTFVGTLSGTATQTAQSVTFNNVGAGAVSGTTFNGSTARTISYNTIGAQISGTYNTIIGTDTDINFTGSTVLSTMTLTDGVIQGFTPRTLTPGDIGAQTALTNPITGTGTTNYLPKFTGTTTLGNSLVYDNGTSVGIGTASPSGKLDVAGNIRLESANQVHFGATGVIAYWNVGVQNTTTNNFEIGGQSYYSGVRHILLNPVNNGNVGIGTTSPSQKLHLQNGVLLVDTNTPASSGIWMPDTNGNPSLRIVTDQSVGSHSSIVNAWGNASNAGVMVGTTRNDGTAFQVRSGVTLTSGFADDTGNTRLIVLGNGNIGIGTTTPDAKLVIDKGSEGLYLKVGGGASGGRALKFTSSTVNGSAGALHTINAISTGGEIALATASSERLRIDNNGNVGIGTTNPAQSNLVVSPSAQSANVDGITVVYNPDGATNRVRGQLKIGNFAGVLELTNGADTISTYITAAGDSFFNGGNVGIGTTNPRNKLDIALTGAEMVYPIATGTSPTGGFRIGHTDTTWAGVELNIGIANASAQGYPAWIQAQNPADLSVSRNLLLNPNGGNVGIGTDNPFGKLDVAGNIRLQSANKVSFGATGVIPYWNVGVQNTTTNNFEIGGQSYYSGVRHILLNPVNNGNVGIGTTAPNSKLDIRSGSSGTFLELIQTAGNANDFVDIKMIAGNTTAGTLGTILRHKRDGSGGGDFSILTNPTLTGTPTEKLTIKSGGNVGIGTTSPGAKLDVTRNTAETTPIVKIYDGNSAQRAALQVIGYSNLGGFRINAADGIRGIYTEGAQIGFATSDTSPITFTQSNSAEKMRIHTNGFVGIGTTSPAAKLHVKGNGTTGVPQVIIDSGGTDKDAILEFWDDGDVVGVVGQYDNSELNLSSHGTIRFNTNTVSIANVNTRMIIQSGGNVSIGNTNNTYKLDVTGTGRFTSTVTATNFILSSDERLKENIVEIQPKKIKANWKSFNIKDSDEGYRVGVIAQELEVEHPEFIVTDSEGFKSVKYIDLLISKIAELENRIKQLEK